MEESNCFRAVTIFNNIFHFFFLFFPDLNSGERFLFLVTWLYGTQELCDASPAWGFLLTPSSSTRFKFCTSAPSHLQRLKRDALCISFANTSTCLPLNGEESAFPAMEKEQHQTDESQIPTEESLLGEITLRKKASLFSNTGVPNEYS